MADGEMFDFLQLSLIDMNGVQRSKTLPFHKVAQAKDSGVCFFGGTHSLGIRGALLALEDLKPPKYPNQLALPDWTTLFSKPWLVEDLCVKQVLADMYWWNETTGDYEPHAACPRILAKKALKELKDIGYSLFSAFEYEFQLLDASTKQPAMVGTDMFNELSIPLKQRRFLYHSCQALQEAGIGIEYFNREYSDGQVEMPLSAQFGIASADSAVKFKSSIKELGQAEDCLVTFMTKTLPGKPANGAHFNFSLWDISQSNNVMFDGSREHNLSEIGQQFLAGIMVHLPALVAIGSPTVNCYRRLCQAWTPLDLTWDIEDRSASIRVKNKNKRETYFENRLVSGPANPYAVTAGVLFAGLDGIHNQMQLPRSATSVGAMPHSLEEALQVLEQDTVMMQKLGTFGEWFIRIKREMEVGKFGRHNLQAFVEEEWNAEREEYLQFA